MKTIDAEPILNAIEKLHGKYGVQADACLETIQTVIECAPDAQVNVPSEGEMENAFEKRFDKTQAYREEFIHYMMEGARFVINHLKNQK